MYGWALVLLFICLGWGMGVPSWQGVGPVPRGLGACGRPAVPCTVQFAWQREKGSNSNLDVVSKGWAEP